MGFFSSQNGSGGRSNVRAHVSWWSRCVRHGKSCVNVREFKLCQQPAASLKNIGLLLFVLQTFISPNYRGLFHF